MEPYVSLSFSQYLFTRSDPEPRDPSKHIYVRSVLALHFLPSSLFPSGFITNFIYLFIKSLMRSISLTHPVILDLIIVIIFREGCKLLLSSFYCLLHRLAPSPLLGPNILINILLPNSLDLCSVLKLRDQDSHSYRRKLESSRF